MTITGTCRFCGQSAMVDVPDSTPEAQQQIIADETATVECHCKEGQDWRTDRYVIEQCEENIEAMFRENYPDIADVFQGAKIMIWHQSLKKITCTTHESGTAAMYRSGGNIEIKFIQKNETKLTASW